MPYKMSIQSAFLERITDNSWFVSYSPTLSRWFQRPLNVYLCILKVGGIEYLFKYICKGRDIETITLRHDKFCYDKVFSKTHATYRLWKQCDDYLEMATSNVICQ